MLLLLLKLILALFVLIWSGGALTTALTRLSNNLKLSYYLVAFILMAATTTVPELFVSIMSSFDGQGTLALGTVLGSNIANIALIVGLLLLINKKINFAGTIKKRIVVYSAVAALVPYLLLFDREVSRLDGVLLLLVFGFIFREVIADSRFFERVSAAKKNFNFWYDIGMFAVSLIVLLISSRYVVNYSVNLATEIAIPVSIIGILILALGTSLPELVFAYKSSKNGTPEMSLGNITGSLIFNSSFVLAIAALISPIAIESRQVYLAPFIFSAVLFSYLALAAIKNKLLTRFAGLTMMILYFVFVYLEIR